MFLFIICKKNKKSTELFFYVGEICLLDWVDP